VTQGVRVQVVDPSAFAPPYDHALCAALAAAGADVELVTSRFAYGPVPEPAGYRLRTGFYRRQPGAPGSRLRAAAKAAQHVPDMMRLRRAARAADLVHFQWLALEELDVLLRPRAVPVVVTAHRPVPYVLRPAQLRARRRLLAGADAVIVHTRHGRERLVGDFGLDPARVAHIRHGVFDYLARLPHEVPLPADLAAVQAPVVLCLGVWRPDHGIDLLLEAWRGIEGAELWVVGLPQMPVEPLVRSAPPGVRFVPRFVTDPELPAFFRRADVVVFPYRAADASGALFSALAFGRPLLVSDVGGFREVAADGAARAVPSGDPAALRAALAGLLADAAGRERLAAAARAAAAGPYSWSAIAAETLGLYGRVLAGQRT
jgi:glycosyltransferase involved in cell wall biosynthesis